MSEVYYIKWTITKCDFVLNKLLSSETRSIITRLPSRKSLMSIIRIRFESRIDAIFVKGFRAKCVTYKNAHRFATFRSITKGIYKRSINNKIKMHSIQDTNLDFEIQNAKLKSRSMSDRVYFIYKLLQIWYFKSAVVVVLHSQYKIDNRLFAGDSNNILNILLINAVLQTFQVIESELRVDVLTECHCPLVFSTLYRFCRRTRGYSSRFEWR